MTYKEAFESIKYELFEEGHCTYIEEELKVAIEALEKQIPKKPSDSLQVTEKEFMVICPNCEIATSAFHGYKLYYCPKCGQALDWSDEK